MKKKSNFFKIFIVIVWIAFLTNSLALAAPEDFDQSVTDSLRDVQIGLDGSLDLDTGDLQSALEDVAEVSSDEGRGLEAPSDEKLELPSEDLGDLSKGLDLGASVSSLKAETDAIKKESEGLTK